MAWDSTKAINDKLAPTEWNAMVTDQKQRIKELSEDTTPELGGFLCLNGHGITQSFIAATGLSSGNLCYLNGAGKMAFANATESTSCSTLLGLAISSITEDSSGDLLLFGIYETTDLTPGANYYVGESDATIVSSAPTTEGSHIRIIGTALSATKLFFNPSWTTTEI